MQVILCHLITSYYPNFTLTLSGEKIIISFLYWTEISSQSKYNHVKKRVGMQNNCSNKDLRNDESRLGIYAPLFTSPSGDSCIV